MGQWYFLGRLNELWVACSRYSVSMVRRGSMLTEYREHATRQNPEFLVVGTAGFDGVCFGYRKGHQGLWACDPIDEDFVFKAQTIASLAESWFSVGFEA